MFYTIFSYLIYLFLALAATIALGYVATSRFALLSRVLVAILGRGLRIIAIEGSEDREGYSLERQEGGEYYRSQLSLGRMYGLIPCSGSQFSV